MVERQITHDRTVEGRVTSLEVRMAVAESDIKNVREDIATIKDDTRWIRRTVTGALIVGAVGIVFGFIKFVLFAS